MDNLKERINYLVETDPENIIDNLLELSEDTGLTFHDINLILRGNLKGKIENLLFKKGLLTD